MARTVKSIVIGMVATSLILFALGADIIKCFYWLGVALVISQIVYD